MNTFAQWVVENKVLEQEVNMYTNKGAPWSDFYVTSKTRAQVEKYLESIMEKYHMGEVYKRIK